MVSGVEDDGEKIRVESYVLKKITNLPLHPIPVAFKWDHLSDLKLADSDLKSPKRIYCCLGLNYSRAFFVMAGGLDLEAHHPQLILALDRYLWKECRYMYVVDVANMTLEQDEMID